MKKDSNWWIARFVIWGAILLFTVAVGYGLANLIPIVKADTPPKSIPELRMQIDAIDDDLLILLNMRQELAKQIGVQKLIEGKAVRDGAREAQVIKRLQLEAKRHGSSLTDQQIADVWTTLMLVSKQAQ